MVGRRLLLLLIAAALSVSGSSRAAAAATVGAAPVMFVVDISGSMADDDGTGRVKIDGAKAALLDSIRALPPDASVGLWTYPSQGSGGGCNQGKLTTGLGPASNRVEMSADVRRLSPDGDTPTAEALRAAAATLGGSGTILLVSDGESTCEPPCDVAREIAAGGLDIRAITVGFRISAEGREELGCIAKALDGTYVDVNDNASLAAAVAELSQPALRIAVDYPKEVIAGVGSDGQGNVTVRATVLNNSPMKAVDVRLRLSMPVDASYGVLHPVRRLGNLESGFTREVSWTFAPSSLSIGRPLEFAVDASARGAAIAPRAVGSIVVVEATSPGEILGSGVVIMGDSFSSGEGSDQYLPGTDEPGGNHCHRSLNTYLAPQLSLSAQNIVACSGALTGDIAAPNQANGVSSQLEQLASLAEGSPDTVSAVVLTLGGNDLGFKDVLLSCAVLSDDCSKQLGSTRLQNDGIDTARYVDERIDALKDDLTAALRDIHGVVNREDVVSRRNGRRVPILVLAYPFTTPMIARSSQQGANGETNVCLSLSGFNSSEAAFMTDLQGRLNGTLEESALNVREDGIPAFFVPDTEMAFFPDHTLCSSTPFARTVSSFNGAAIDWSAVARVSVENVLARLPYVSWTPAPVLAAADTKEVASEYAKRSFAELFHPNADGYQAMSQRVFRWSHSASATSALEFTRNTNPATASPPSWRVSDVDLGQLAPGTVPTLQGNTTYPLTVQGFAPGTSVQIVLQSIPRLLATATADDKGVIASRIAIRHDIDGGNHMLRVVGIRPDGKTQMTTIPVKISAQSWDGVLIALIAGGMIVVVGMCLTWVDRRRVRSAQ